MRKPPKRPAPPLKSIALLFVAFLFTAASAGRAQAPELENRLPADTLFYLYWRGADSLGPQNTDPLVGLWNDPDFAAVRDFVRQDVAAGLARNPRLARVPLDQWEALLRNPLVVGARLGPATVGLKQRPQGFLIVAAQGKTAPNARAVLAAAGPGAAAIARLTPADYLVLSRDPPTLDELARRFVSPSPAAGDTLAALPAYRDARQELDGTPPLEFFLRVPDLSQFQAGTPQGLNFADFARALHLERIHTLCGGLDLRSPTAAARFSILGDTTPGSPLDFFGANSASFATLAAAPTGASVNISKLDFGALVSDLLNAVSASSNQDQAAQIKMLGGLITSSVIPVLGGEFAEIWIHPGLPPSGNPPLVAITIRQAEAANQLFQTTLAPFVKPEGQEGQIRYFRTNSRQSAAAPARPGKAGAGIESNFLALTPQLLLGGKDERIVRERAAVVVSGVPGGLTTDPRFRTARADLPPELSGLAYFDFERFNWSQWAEQMAAQTAKNPRSSSRAEELSAWAERGGAAVYARYLHQLIIGSWKDGQGIHWRGYLH
ncbi:MAG TPA: hypothetical protein VGS20_15240 [Candidatus Acidoferrales bacterium]|nr:hypothetical protein [Candidatus Acidoferrales bacterium]